MSGDIFASQGCFNFSMETLRLRVALKEYQDRIVAIEHDNLNLLNKLQEQKELVIKTLEVPNIPLTAKELLVGLIHGW
jgi:hypothetical protein